jgi:hypothetical protein
MDQLLKRYVDTFESDADENTIVIEHKSLIALVWQPQHTRALIELLLKDDTYPLLKMTHLVYVHCCETLGRTPFPLEDFM